MAVYLLQEQEDFPDPAWAEENGLLAVGGDLSPARLLRAYAKGIFPWYGPGQPLLWWSPNPRWVLEPTAFHCSKRLARLMRQAVFRVTFDQAFSAVIKACATVPRGDGEGTWLSEEMQMAYGHLHALGYAHSVECWQDGQLVGGLYGVQIGAVFFGESMFSRVSNGSKVALATLVAEAEQRNIRLLDCQMETTHLVSLGAKAVSRAWFQSHLAQWGKK